MGYSKKTDVIKRVEEYLDQLLGVEESISWKSAYPTKLAYQLREALALAATQPASKYNQLKAKFVIRARQSTVIAESRISAPIIALSKTLSRQTFPDIADVFGIVGAAIKNKGEELFFPIAKLDKFDLTKLYAWTHISGYFIVVSDRDSMGLTLTKNDPGSLAWKP